MAVYLLIAMTYANYLINYTHYIRLKTANQIYSRCLSELFNSFISLCYSSLVWQFEYDESQTGEMWYTIWYCWIFKPQDWDQKCINQSVTFLAVTGTCVFHIFIPYQGRVCVFWQQKRRVLVAMTTQWPEFTQIYYNLSKTL